MQASPLYLDLETYCETPINYGTHRYAENAEIMVVAYALGDGPVKVWDCTTNTEMPQDLLEALHDEETPVVIHNSSFDRTVLRHAWNWHIKPERIRDTMVRARTLGLPGSLGTLCDILKIPTDKAKDKRGKELIQLFCKPLNKNNTLRRATRETHPEEWRQFLDYARLDVEAMRATNCLLPAWNHRDGEFALWCLDQKINDRGVRVDTQLAESALRAITHTKRQLDADTSEATLGCVGSASQRDELLGFILGAYGVELPDMQKATLERRIDDPELPQGLKELLALRLQTCTTSTAKYKTLLNSVSSDGRLRGILEFCGAGRTGRWAGRKFQPQNLPSRNLLPQDDIDRGIELLKLDSADVVYGDIMKLTSSCIRGAIIPSEGKKLVVSDLANIEGRVAAWLAGEEWKLQAFRDFDNGIGPDLYILSYARAFNVALDSVTKTQRQIGKVMELMLQYEGGVGAFITGAASYGIDLDAMADAAWSSIPERVKAEAKRAWEWAVTPQIVKDISGIPETKTFGLKEKTYIVCDSLKRMWRLAHLEISGYWGHLKTTTIIVSHTISKVPFWCNRVQVTRNGSWTRILLPSGRSLCYASMREEDGNLSYSGVNQYSKKWGRIGTYGGKLFENMCQAVARDVMAHNMPAIEMAGYDVLMTVHDEVVTEAPDNDNFTAEHLSSLLATNPPWAPDLPLAASGFESNRYRKG